MADPRNKVEIFWPLQDHQAFVRHEVGRPDGRGLWWIVYCPGCEEWWKGAYESWAAAHRQAIAHRVDYEAWIPAGENVYGPVANWGTQPM